MSGIYFGRKSSAWRFSAMTVAMSMLSGCNSLQRPTEAEQRIREQCTDITSVLRKNYSIGGNFEAVVAKLSFQWASTGVVLSGEANERLIQLDYLCRQYATGKISPDTWANLQNSYIIASVKSAQGNTSPEAQKQLRENLETLRKSTDQLAKLRGEATSRLPPTEEILRTAIQTSNDDLRVTLDAMFIKFGDAMSTDNRMLSAQLRDTRQELEVLRAMLERTLEVLPKPPVPVPPPLVQIPTWSATAGPKIRFALNKSGLTDEAKELLKAQLSGLKTLLDYRVQLTGYTDPSGSAVLNARLSVARAEETRDFLVDDIGLDTSKVFVRGSGHTPTRLALGNAGRIVEVRIQMLEVTK
jgi:outer membrane protein OmpA-like peptidoglycan-associated protein